MSNVYKVLDYITKETTTLMHERGSFINTIDRQYDDQFKNNGQGAKGKTIRVRRPEFGDVRETRQMDVKDIEETSDSFTVANWIGTDLSITHDEAMQSANNDGAWDEFSKNRLEPRINRLISILDQKALEYAFKHTANIVGSPGSAWTNGSYPGKARAKLNQSLAPEGDPRFMQIDSNSMEGIVTGTATYFNPQTDNSKAFLEGYYGRAAGFKWYENERVYTHLNGDDVAGAVVGASTTFDQGCVTINVGTLGTTVTEGSNFTIESMYDCHFETKQPYPTLKQFVVIGTPTIAGNAGNITFWPPIYTTGPKKNVCTSTGSDITWTSAGQNGKVVTFVGSANASYRQALAYAKQAYQIAFCDLPLVDDAHKCRRVSKEGLAFRVWMGNDIRNSELLVRIDMLYGFAALNAQWGCRMIGAANT